MPLSTITRTAAAALGAVLLAAQNGAVLAQHPPPHVLAALDVSPAPASCPGGKPVCGKGPTAACCTDKEWCSEFFGNVCKPLRPPHDESATVADASHVFAADADAAGASPSGEYSGSANMLGITFKSTVRVDSAAKADMTIAASGLLSFNINCREESFSVTSGGSVHVGTGGDCLHKGLSKQGITLKSVKYNGGADKLTVVANKLGLDVTLVLNKKHFASAEADASHVFAADADAAGASPSGEYSGSANMLGITFKSTVRVDSAAKADMTIAASGLLSFNINCREESFSVTSGGSVHVGTGGDCLHKGLSKQGITLKSVKYNGGADKLTVVANKLGLDVTLVLNKKHFASAEGSQPRYFRGTPELNYGA